MRSFIILCLCIHLSLNVSAILYPEGQSSGHKKGGQKVVVTYETTVVKGSGGGQGPGPQPLFDSAKSIGLNRFCDYMEQAGLQDMLNEPGPYTIFAPSDESFERLPSESFGEVTGNKEKLREVMQFHCVQGNFDFSNLQEQSGSVLSTTNENWGLRVEKYGDVVTVNGCPVTTYDQGASNGIIHVLDGVMYPLPQGDIGQTLEKSPSFEKLMQLIRQTNIREEYLSGNKPFTFLAPNDAAFAKLDPETLKWLESNPEKIKELMQQHIVRGTYYTSCLNGGVQDLPTVAQGNIKLQKNQEGYLFNDVLVDRPDISCTNGVIHSINQVLIPSGFGPVHGGDAKFDVRYPSDDELDKLRGGTGYGGPGKPLGPSGNYQVTGSQNQAGAIGGPNVGSGPYGGGAPGGGKPYTGVGRPVGGVPGGPGAGSRPVGGVPGGPGAGSRPVGGGQGGPGKGSGPYGGGAPGGRPYTGVGRPVGGVPGGPGSAGGKPGGPGSFGGVQGGPGSAGGKPGGPGSFGGVQGGPGPIDGKPQNGDSFVDSGYGGPGPVGGGPGGPGSFDGGVSGGPVDGKPHKGGQTVQGGSGVIGSGSYGEVSGPVGGGPIGGPGGKSDKIKGVECQCAEEVKAEQQKAPVVVSSYK